MTFSVLDNYLLSKKGATFDYPFDEKVRVYRIDKKIFALTSEDSPISVNFKTQSNFRSTSTEYSYISKLQVSLF